MVYIYTYLTFQGSLDENEGGRRGDSWEGGGRRGEGVEVGGRRGEGIEGGGRRGEGVEGGGRRALPSQNSSLREGRRGSSVESGEREGGEEGRNLVVYNWLKSKKSTKVTYYRIVRNCDRFIIN